ncbi:MAG: penicillin acylase family protein, partial [Sphingomonadaceae bacterium]|nr:penicillin acylase family protein [Sphingomonadaceae bacterium]
DVLAAWDRRTNVESRGAVLFSLWALGFAASQPGGVYERPWSFAAPTQWPDGLADDAAAVSALVATVESMEAGGIPLDLPWGEFARSPDGAGGTLPSNLGMGSLGAFRVGFFEPNPAGGAPIFNGGTSWVAAIEFGEQVSARAILPYGNFAVRPEGIEEQYSLFARGELRGVNFSEATVAAATVFEERLGRGE